MLVNFNDKQAEIVEALLTSYIEDSRHAEEPVTSRNAAINARQKVVCARAGKKFIPDELHKIYNGKMVSA